MQEERKTLNLLKACALEYKGGMQAPILKALGEGKSAEYIVEIAKQHEISIREGESESFFKMLKNVKVNEAIPVELYEATARIFAYFLTKNRQN